MREIPQFLPYGAPSRADGADRPLRVADVGLGVALDDVSFKRFSVLPPDSASLR